MPLFYIFEKLFMKKSKNYKSIKSSLILQNFHRKLKILKYHAVI